MSEYWGGVTDPGQHDPTSFRYLVHGLNLGDTSHAAYLRRRAIDLGIGDIPGQAIDLSAEPHRIRETVTKSTSLIDPHYTTLTWAWAGLILGVPAEDVLITSPHVIGAVNGDRQRVLELWGGRYPTDLSPEELLDQSGPYSYNEVVVATGNAAVLGFFTKTRPATGVPVNREVTERLSHHAADLGVPMVEIPLQIQPGSYPPYKYR